MKNLYLAGLFDGEGHISIYKKNHCQSDCNWTQDFLYYPVVKIGMTAGWDILRKLQKIYKGTLYLRKYPTDQQKDLLVWTLRGQENILKFLNAIAEHLIIKEKQAKIIYEFYREWKFQGIPLPEEEWKRRENLYLQIKQLNHRGKDLSLATTK